MKNEARFIDQIDKEIKKEKLIRVIFSIVGVISIAIPFILSATAKGEELPELIMILSFAFGLSLVIIGTILVSLAISDNKRCKEILKEIFKEFPINKEKMKIIDGNINFPEELDLEGKLLLTLSRDIKSKIKLYQPPKEDSIGVRVKIEGYDYFNHTVNIFNSTELNKLRNFLIES